ncbi:YhfG family protein [Pseudomonas taiwanensis]|uniref:YhfG family protein n=1 Tax=Pseudomonas taiwanensis TaxID=470150 RepID=UPI0015B9DE8C|nr:YhfG family protein [Pseudomonas taiwanensis]
MRERPANANPSLQAKKAYYAKARQSNYAASLRLKGVDVTPADAERKLPSRESVLSAYHSRQG